MLKQTVTKSALFLILMLLASSFSKTIAQQASLPATASLPTPGGDPGGGNPDPTGCDGGPCLVALHLI